jgi:glycine/D-amino acid oxidase-like deaminating enzyme
MWHAPLTVDPSGVYFRPEGASSTETYLCGVSPDAPYDEDVWDADGLAVSESDHTRLFEETIWPVLYNRAEAFGEMKVLGSSEDAVLMTSNRLPLMTSDCLPHQVLGSWAGWYEYNTFDQNAIIGWHPDLPNVVHLNGFSGHGLQHAPAAGRAVAELVEHGAFRTLDLSLFSFDRVMEGRPVLETGIV